MQLTPALKAGKFDLARDLISRGADVNFEDEHGLTPLVYAVESGSVGAVRLLLQAGAGAQVQSGPKGTSLLHDAANHGQLEIYRLLLENGADPDPRTVDNRTPLHFAASAQFGMSMTDFLIRNGAQIDAVDNYRHTPLHYAATGLCYGNVFILARAGADKRARNDSGHTALEWMLEVLDSYRGRKGNFLTRYSYEVSSVEEIIRILSD
jgi:ankyrin repeat protein